jgi:SAM-dependent methyltransferase
LEVDKLPALPKNTLMVTSASYTKKVLNVGGNNKDISIPDHYKGWEHALLDIDPRGNPDVVCDARELLGLDANTYDAVYCSHNLEHYYRHEVPKVLNGFYHVLKEDGFAEIRVPDLAELMRIVVENKLDIDDFLYQSPAGPITVRDVIYGYGVEIERSQSDYFAHKTGFTAKSLLRILNECGFGHLYSGTANISIRVLAFKATPNDYCQKLLNISA